MTGIEILALIFAVIVIIKAVMLFVSPKSSLRKAKYFFERPALVIGIYIVLLAVTGYIVIPIIGIVNTFAATAFGVSLIALNLAVYPKQAMKLTKIILKNRKKMILPLIIWTALAVWVLYALFA
jgi:hypothetical protein